MAPKKQQAASRGPKHIFDARPDTLDFRDKMYVPTLVEVPVRIALSDYVKHKVPILDQGQEGACTGFGLATVANYLLRVRKTVPDAQAVSPRMLYIMARRYDEWPGERYEGSSARGAMKGWHKHGVCAERLWHAASAHGALSERRVTDASRRPLGAYFRVNHKDLVAIHSALSEVGVLYATALVHAGWDRVKSDGQIPISRDIQGGHAFAIVAYDENGLWIQNSWGPGWGLDGFALIAYDDWLANGTDVWAARLGAPVTLTRPESTAISHSASAGQSAFASRHDLYPHIISIGNEGVLNPAGTFGTTQEEVNEIFQRSFPRITAHWKKKRILLYAHGGLVGESTAVQRLADYRATLLEKEIYPLSFIWHTDYWTTITNNLEDVSRRRRPEGFLDAAKDFMLDRLDDAIEPLARNLTGKAGWDEMKENALLATESRNGGARFALRQLAELAKKTSWEIHVAGHSAGSIFHAPLIRLLTTKGAGGLGLNVASCTLWAPACTIRLFRDYYLPAIRSGMIERFALFTLTDEAEQDDHCAHIYHKSLLYLVSNAFEEKPRIPLPGPLGRDGESILGLEKSVRKDQQLMSLFGNGKADWILAPNDAEEGSAFRSTARHHSDFDDDAPTLAATLARILGTPQPEARFVFNRSASSLRERRLQLA